MSKPHSLICIIDDNIVEIKQVLFRAQISTIKISDVVLKEIVEVGMTFFLEIIHSDKKIIYKFLTFDSASEFRKLIKEFDSFNNAVNDFSEVQLEELSEKSLSWDEFFIYIVGVRVGIPILVFIAIMYYENTTTHTEESLLTNIAAISFMGAVIGLINSIYLATKMDK